MMEFRSQDCYTIRRSYIFIFLIGMVMNVYGQGKGNNNAFITTWYHSMPGAISITFDDACLTQYSFAYPVLEKLNIKATFSIVGEWVKDEPSYSAEAGSFEIKKMGWTQLLEIHSHGHELAAHGFIHEKYDINMQVPQLAQKMKAIKDLIEEKTREPVYTMNYPYSYASGNIAIAAKEAGYLFGRTGLNNINPPHPENMYLLATQAILNAFLPDTTTFQNWITRSDSNWLILMYHHFFERDSKEMNILKSHNVSYSYSIYPDLFEWQMREAVKSGCWIAPVATIGKYITERDNTRLKIKRCKRRITITTLTELDKKVYDQTLTMAIELPWQSVSIEGSINDGTIEVVGKYVYIDFKPGAKIHIKRAH